MRCLLGLILILSSFPAYAKVKNLILLIGDGMGPQQISLLYSYSKYATQKDKRAVPFAFEKLSKKGVVAISATEPYGGMVVDSACSATHLAGGEYSRAEMVGVNKEGNSIQSILVKAKRAGKATGIVTDTNITHATPAAFYANVASRHFESKIAEELLKTQPDVALGGGLGYFLPQSSSEKVGIGRIVKSRRKDLKNLLAMARQQNYEVSLNLEQLKNSKKNKLLGLFSDGGLPGAIWQSRNLSSPTRAVPNLLEMTEKSLTILEKNKKGFFLMVEGGQIDWAGHNNDAGSLLHEMIQFNQVLNKLIAYTEKRDDTLLVVTADHETGGFGIAYKSEGVPRPLKLPGTHFKNKSYSPNMDYGKYRVLDGLYKQKESLVKIVENFYRLKREKQTAVMLRQLISSNLDFEFTLADAKKFLEQKSIDLPSKGRLSSFVRKEFGKRAAVISRLMTRKTGVVWSTNFHTATPVNVFALGPAKEQSIFKGYLTHPEVGQLLQKVLVPGL